MSTNYAIPFLVLLLHAFSFGFQVDLSGQSKPSDTRSVRYNNTVTESKDERVDDFSSKAVPLSPEDSIKTMKIQPGYKMIPGTHRTRYTRTVGGSLGTEMDGCTSLKCERICKISTARINWLQ